MSKATARRFRIDGWRVPAVPDNAPFQVRLAAYRQMMGMAAYHQIALDWRAGKISMEDAWAYRDAIYPLSEENPSTDIMRAGTYWAKRIYPHKNSKFVQMEKLRDGLWSKGWKHTRWDRDTFDLDPCDQYMFMGPLP
jgi:hypothetical protein